MTVAENLVLSRGRRAGASSTGSEETARARGVPGDACRSASPLDAPVGALAAGEKQKLEILKQLYLEPRLLILDEPTSVLTPQEADEVLGLLRAMTRSAASCTVLMITHKFREVMAFADEVTVLRRGRLAGSGRSRDLTPRGHGAR